MRYTNKLNLPQPIVDAVTNDPYSKGDADYSITGLLKPPRISELERRHWSDLEEDIADRMYSLAGQVVHGILERAEKVAFPEERFFASIEGKRISGAVDRLVLFDRPRLLQDYKFVTLWKFQEGVPEDFEAQLNCYNWLLSQNGFEIDELQIVAIFRDWSRGKSKRDDRYPQSGVQVFPIEKWDLKITEAYIRSRINRHEWAKETLPSCSPEERWCSAEVWAVKKPGSTRAVNGGIYFSKAEAEAHVKGFSGKGYELEHRRGENKRCLDWCKVSQFCDQWKEIQDVGAPI